MWEIAHTGKISNLTHHRILKEKEQKFGFNELHDDDDQLMQGNQRRSIKKSSYAYILIACVKQQILGI